MAEGPDGVSREDTARMLHEVAARSSRILQEFGHKHVHQTLSAALKDELGIAKAYMDLYSRLLMDPSAMAAASVNFWIDSMRLWQSAWLKMLGHDCGPLRLPLVECDDAEREHVRGVLAAHGLLEGVPAA